MFYICTSALEPPGGKTVTGFAQSFIKIPSLLQNALSPHSRLCLSLLLSWLRHASESTQPARPVFILEVSTTTMEIV